MRRPILVKDAKTFYTIANEFNLVDVFFTFSPFSVSSLMFTAPFNSLPSLHQSGRDANLVPKEDFHANNYTDNYLGNYIKSMFPCLNCRFLSYLWL